MTGVSMSPSALRSTTIRALFEEGFEIVRSLWSSDVPITHRGRYYQFENVSITPKPLQRPMPAYVASFSQTSIELAARLGCGLIVAPFAAAMTFGGLKQVAQVYKEACARHSNAPGRLMCSYFTHFADTKAQEAAAPIASDSLLQGVRHPGISGDRQNAPPSYRYFINMVERLQNVRPEDLTENSVLLGSPGKITETLKMVEAAGFDEVILYFNVGLKPHAQVKEEMDRFMMEVAPAFETSIWNGFKPPANLSLETPRLP